MDIERMHEMIEKLSEAAECEFNKGIENVDTCEMDKVVDMMKDLSEAMYYRTLTKAMQESDTEEIMEMFDRYGDDEKRYYDMWRYGSGRFAPKGRGKRRGYDEPPYYHIAPDMYRNNEPEYLRDIDYGSGRMYYAEKPEHIIDDTKNGNMSRYDRAKRGYEEAKNMNDTSADGKRKSMENLESYMKELSEDMTQFIGKMDANEKAMVRSKLQNLMTKIQ